MMSSFKTVQRKRQNNDQKWILLLISIFSINAMVTNGARICAFMFYRLQYNATGIDYGNMASVYFITSGFGQVVIIPLLTKKYKWRDTSILIWAFVPACIAWTAEAFYDQLWLPFLNRSVFYILWANLFTTTRSAMSKMLDPSEVGKAFSFLGVLESGLSLIIRPIFGLLYRETVDIFPGTWVLVSTGLLTIALGLIVVVHVGTKETNSEVNEEVMNKMKP